MPPITSDRTTSARTPKSGIYQIRHAASGKAYVGSAARLQNRWSVHQHHLAKGRHHSRHLQNAWDKYGPDAFVFEVLEYVADKAELVPKEQEWIDRLRSCDPSRGYNMYPTAGSPLGRTVSAAARAKIGEARRGKKLPPEVCKKMSAFQTERYKDPEERARASAKATEFLSNPEVRAKISKANTGRKHSDETKEKIAAAKRGKKRPPEVCKKIGDAQKGKTLSPEHCKKISEAHTGTKRSPETCDKISEANKKHLSDPENKARRVAILRESVGTPEARENHKEACKKRGQDPEYRAKMSAAAKKGAAMRAAAKAQKLIASQSEFGFMAGP